MEEMREFRLDEISIRSIAVDLLKNAWVIFLAALAAWFAVAGVEKLMYVPEYTATATLAVNAKGNTSSAYTSLSLTSQMAGVFSEVFDSSVLREKIAEDLGQDSIEGTITSAVIEETNLVTLSVTSVTPRQTYLIIQSALENYGTVSDYLFSNAVLRIVQQPSVPYSPSNVPNIQRIQKLGMLAAACAAAAVIILLSVLRFTVKNKAAAERNLDGKLLGMIPYERKHRTIREISRGKNKSLLLNTPLVSLHFAERTRKVMTRIIHHMNRRNQKVILITSVAENEGKSSIAANLALALAEKGKRTLLVDADLKKPAQYRIFDKPETGKRWLSDYLSGKAGANDILVHDGKNRLFCIFQESGVRGSGTLLDSERMRSLIRACRRNTDYIIIDSAPMALSSDAELMMTLADTVVLVVRQDWTDIRAVNDAADAVRASGTEFAGFVLNAFQKEPFAQEGRRYGRYYRRQRTDS